MGAIEKLQLLENNLFKADGLPKPIVLVGQNGSGKTTLLSSIVDALYELANNSFDDVLPKLGTGYNYFKVSGSSNLRVNQIYGYSFVNFKENDQMFEYIDKNGTLTFQECQNKTNNLLTLSQEWTDDKNYKKSSITKNIGTFEKDFKANSYCYFPSDRFELPYWINRETVSKSEQFADAVSFSGRLDKDILIRKSLSEIKNWILDVFLDSRADIESYEEKGQTLLRIKQTAESVLHLQKGIENIEILLSSILQKKISLNINYRGQYSSRIKIMDKFTGKDYIPSLDNLSAGQSTLLGIFATIIKHSDKTDINKSVVLSEIKGIVLIDEIDLHLHIGLQKDVLPSLIKLFPKIQFLVTSHSPFFLNGMSKVFSDDEFLMINMPNGSMLRRSDDFEEFNRAYEIFGDLTNTYKIEFQKLKDEVEKSNKPLIITEGKTDWKHLKKALEKLKSDYVDFDIEFLEYNDEIKMGDAVLDRMIDELKKVPNSRKIICIFDRDNENILKKHGTDEFTTHGNNVFSLCIPKIDDDLDKISIEFYYNENELKSLDGNNRRLFLGKEFDPISGVSECKNYVLQDKQKAGKKIVIDTFVYKIDDNESSALSKENFAKNIFENLRGFDSFSFNHFKKIYDVVKKIEGQQ